jgi:hypothetical protein
MSSQFTVAVHYGGVCFIDFDEVFEVLDSKAGEAGRALVDAIDGQASGSISRATSDNQSSSLPGIAVTQAIVKTELGVAMIRRPYAVR